LSLAWNLDLKVLKTKAHDAIVISHASIIIPFTLGSGWPTTSTRHLPRKGSASPRSPCFIAIAMSITLSLCWRGSSRSGGHSQNPPGIRLS
jgi:hypothetical protein